MIGSGGELQLFCGANQERAGFGVQSGCRSNESSWCGSIGGAAAAEGCFFLGPARCADIVVAEGSVATALPEPSCEHAASHRCGAFGGALFREFGGWDSLHMNMQVNAIGERSGESVSVSFYFTG